MVANANRKKILACTRISKPLQASALITELFIGTAGPNKNPSSNLIPYTSQPALVSVIEDEYLTGFFLSKLSTIPADVAV